MHQGGSEQYISEKNASQKKGLCGNTTSRCQICSALGRCSRAQNPQPTANDVQCLGPLPRVVTCTTKGVAQQRRCWWTDSQQRRVEHLGLTHFTCHEKSMPPTTENWPRKLYIYSLNNNTSTEDKHETNHINNKYNDTNTDTRKLHNL